MSIEKLKKTSSSDLKHGLAFGFAIVSKANGEDFIDSQNDHIPVDAMIDASVDFMENSRLAKEMHEGGARGSIPFAMPITQEIRKFIIENDFEGLLIGMRPDEDMLKKIESGTFSGFSIGGKVEDAEAVQET